MATRFASTPIGAAVPNANAVIGAVSSVAASAGATSRAARGSFAAALPAQTTAATAATESHAPTDCTAQGSTHSSSSTVRARYPRGATTRWRQRATACSRNMRAARVAGAGSPSSHT